MIDYHDQVWGLPEHDDQVLFEFLLLEGAQAGLSWDTILKKRENYRKAFDQFDPDAARPVHGFQARRLRKASIEERARELGRRTVSGAMMNELLELQSSLGMAGGTFRVRGVRRGPATAIFPW